MQINLNIRHICVLLVIFFAMKLSLVYAQVSSENRLKYGISLSGGGAKGLAHIGLLKMIDSLQIQVDYLTGTSMGGVIGSFYAAGYSADSIEQIVSGVDWNRVLSNRQAYNRIVLPEKNAYDAYAFEFPVKRGIPSLPGSLIEGQYLSQILSKYLFHTRGIHNFNKLPIPLKMVAVDILNGDTVRMQSGFLPLSVRATLSIPAVFSPTIIGKQILVDGGLNRNYPVEEVRKMGANVVIGGYTGYTLQNEEALQNPFKLINQTYAFRALEDAAQQIQLADTTLNFVEALKPFAVSDFSRYKEIIAVGLHEARKLVPWLKEIKQQQMQQGIVWKKKVMPDYVADIDSICFYNERGRELSVKEKEFPEKLIGEDFRLLDNAAQIDLKIEQLLGYNFYDKVYYTYTSDSVENKTLLNFFFKNKPQGTFRAAAHYDSSASASILLNYTYRNLLRYQSRLSATIELSERGKARLSYYTFLDTKNRWWGEAKASWINQKSHNLFFRLISQLYNFSEIQFMQSHEKIRLASGYLFTPNIGIQMGLEYRREQLRRTNNLFSDFFEKESGSKKALYTHSGLTATLEFNQNNFNRKYMPSSGNKLHFSLSVSGADSYRLQKPGKKNLAENYIYNSLHPDSTFFRNRHYNHEKILRLSLSERWAIPFGKKFSFHGAFFYGLNIKLHGAHKGVLGSDDYLFLNQKFYVGGHADMEQNNNLIFTGLNRNEYPTNNVISLYLALQYTLFKNVYLTPSISVGREIGKSDDLPENNKNLLWGYGIDLNYMSLIGPMKLSICRSGTLLQNRMFISLGYLF